MLKVTDVKMHTRAMLRKGRFQWSAWTISLCPDEGYSSGPSGPALGDEEFLKILVVRDSMSKAVFAHAVPSKGVDENRYAVDMVTECCNWLGYSKLLLKADNESAVLEACHRVIGSVESRWDQAGRSGELSPV